MGDFVKGLLPAGLQPDLAAGVALHRRIDSFADRHPAFQRSRERVSPARRRYAGIMVDLFYDHFLALRWDEFGPGELAAFSAQTYALLTERHQELPEKLAALLPFMIRGDWLTSYRQPENVALALDRMAEKRLSRPNPLAGAGMELLADYAGFESDFRAFLPDALAFTAGLRAERNVGV
jgi:acyl carrier protein phosphodiesterase